LIYFQVNDQLVLYVEAYVSVTLCCKNVSIKYIYINSIEMNHNGFDNFQLLVTAVFQNQKEILVIKSYETISKLRLDEM